MKKSYKVVCYDDLGGILEVNYLAESKAEVSDVFFTEFLSEEFDNGMDLEWNWNYEIIEM